jgi:hexosaminidase
LIGLATEIDDRYIYFTFDETNPDNYYPKYNSPLSVLNDAVTLKVVTYRGNKQMGKRINLTNADLKKGSKII